MKKRRVGTQTMLHVTPRAFSRTLSGMLKKKVDCKRKGKKNKYYPCKGTTASVSGYCQNCVREFYRKKNEENGRNKKRRGDVN